MLEQTLQYINELSPFWILMILFLFSFIENIFPPSPSDVVVVAGAALIAKAGSGINFIPVLLITSFGSSLGFMLMYFVGKFFGEKILRTGKIKFISREAIEKEDKWFAKYGYKLILANRFMPGTRSIISFFSGISELEPVKTFLLATISAFAWNAIVIFLGMQLGANVELVDKYLRMYGNIGLIITVIVVLFFAVKYLLPKFRKKEKK